MQNMKGHPINHSKNTKARQYAVMLLLALAAAVGGVMILHMFRERRIFSILLKDKDAQILTLQFLLQKERDHAKEVKHKTEEIKLKVNSLRAQKTDLNAKLLELNSMFSTVKEEHKAMELLIEEKQGEINLLRQQQQQQPAIDNNDIASMDLTNHAEETVNSNQEQNDVDRELGSESEKVGSMDTIDTKEPDQDWSVTPNVESNNNQAHGDEGGGNREEIMATKLESASENTATKTTRVHRSRRSGHSKEKKWKMLIKSRRSQARSKDGSGAAVETGGKLDRQSGNDDNSGGMSEDHVNLSSTVPDEVEQLRDRNGGDQNTGTDGDEQTIVSNGEQTTAEVERGEDSEHDQHSEVTVVDDEGNNFMKPDKIVESVVSEDIKEGGKDEDAKQEEGGGGGGGGDDDDQQQHQEQEEF